MDLTEAMWEATDSPPPTTIDVDRLITGERRRARSLRVAGVAAAVTILAFAATLMPRYFGESLAPPPVAAGSVQPVPSGMHSNTTWPPCEVTTVEGDPPLHPVTEACEHAVARLAATFGGNFQAILGNDWPTPRFVRVPSWNVSYLASWDYNYKGHVFHLHVLLYANPKDKAEWADATCEDHLCRKETVNGLPVLFSSGPSVQVSRPDGTEVSVGVDSQQAGQAPPLTEAQVLQLATAPEMTLYPTTP